jgi:hypothetical protein
LGRRKLGTQVWIRSGSIERAERLGVDSAAIPEDGSPLP